ncbi:FKBP-type peptidyl-prolyl cis-trans isomerase [Leifsonia sp. NCR5]|uniref:FKBP-type peptidyl-prolyl cis-trans isomerase n=1 Tax=Leifsonia sp. NCR5 TaxID=1978342 RepID=UPI002119E059|nr:FKBP-type peptidyl-prolyl cis-trans isomerase [Leifsonia sp. NCR5]
MRKTLSIVTAALVVAGLAACSSGAPNASATPDANGCLNIQPGDTSKSITVDGKFGATPKVTIPTPLKTTDIERSVVIKGNGAMVKGGDSIGIALVAYNGTTGKELTPAAGFDGQPAQSIKVDDKAFVPGLVRAVECLPLKSRVVLTSTTKEAFGDADVSSLKLKASDPVVFVADLVEKEPTRATGKSVTPPEGFPTVKLAKDGAPTVTIPKTDPPTETKIGVLKQGDGAEVKATDTVTIQYSGLLWRNGQVFDSTWAKGQAYSGVASQFVPGFTKALVGQKVGSQIIAIIPPADGYGSKGNGDIKGTDTMVFVVDILKAVG